MRVEYNSPVILTYAIISCGVMAASDIVPGVRYLFSAPAHIHLTGVFFYFRLFSHIAGHADWQHLLSNFSFILLIGPVAEEKYGSRSLLFMILVTALAIGLLNAIFFSTGLVGASGIVFMLIVLLSFTNASEGRIPLTFVLVAVIFFGKELVMSLRPDGISQFAHIIGGLTGAAFGYFVKPKYILQDIN
ncbi:MAG: rhomboid family intramembrane serine protease [Nitrospirae bacterium]|nr:rhomboid family intramembrane serine protease [Nitrospirota bacterium]